MVSCPYLPAPAASAPGSGHFVPFRANGRFRYKRAQRNGDQALRSFIGLGTMAMYWRDVANHPTDLDALVTPTGQVLQPFHPPFAMAYDY
jgi:hypothetical protein